MIETVSGTIGQAIIGVAALVVLLWAVLSDDGRGGNRRTFYEPDELYMTIIDSTTYAITLRDNPGVELFRGSFVECSEWIANNTVER